MKKFLALALSLSMVLGLSACGGGSSSSGSSSSDTSGSSGSSSTASTDSGSTAASTPADSGTAADSTPADSGSTQSAGAADMRVAMVTDYGDITDQSFNQTTYEAGKAWCEANGVDFTYFKPAGDSDAERVAMIESAVDNDYNVIILPGYAFGNAIKETAGVYDDVTFIALDVGPGDLGDYTPPANLYCAVYQEELSGYMAGYAAVKLGYNHLGFLGGMAVPAVERFGYGYIQGADAAAKDSGADVTLEFVYGNQFYGDADITAYMDTWYQQLGVELVFACGGGIWNSAGEAAAKVGAKVIGVDTDQAPVIDAKFGEGITVTSAMKGLAVTVSTTLDQVKNGTFQGGQIDTLGLVSADPEENFVKLPTESTQWSESFTQEDYSALVASLYDGSVTVSSDISAMPIASTITVNTYGNIK